jgi:hypothetical protein
MMCSVVIHTSFRRFVETLCFLIHRLKVNLVHQFEWDFVLRVKFIVCLDILIQNAC